MDDTLASFLNRQIQKHNHPPMRVVSTMVIPNRKSRLFRLPLTAALNCLRAAIEVLAESWQSPLLARILKIESLRLTKIVC